jgi:hypothetical protein
MQTLFTGDDRMLLPSDGKLVMKKLASFILSYIRDFKLVWASKFDETSKYETGLAVYGSLFQAQKWYFKILIGNINTIAILMQQISFSQKKVLLLTLKSLNAVIFILFSFHIFRNDKYTYINCWSNFHFYSEHGCAYLTIMQIQIFNLSLKNFCKKNGNRCTFRLLKSL